MVQSCEELWNWSWTCDVSNLQTMTVEILIALGLAGLAIGVARIFYKKETKLTLTLSNLESEFEKLKQREKLIRKKEKMIDNTWSILVKLKSHLNECMKYNHEIMESSDPKKIKDLQTAKRELAAIMQVMLKDLPSDISKNQKERVESIIELIYKNPIKKEDEKNTVNLDMDHCKKVNISIEELLKSLDS